MMAYFARDEVAPQEDSCDAELALHAHLSAEPFAAVSEEELDAIKDRDVVHNYRAVLAFRDFLAQYATLESAYLAVVRGAPVNFPPLFLEQMTQIILRSILDGETDTMKLRAAECLFRYQTVTLDDGRIMVADHATVQLQAGMARMLQRARRPTRSASTSSPLRRRMNTGRAPTCSTPRSILPIPSRRWTGCAA